MAVLSGFKGAQLRLNKWAVKRAYSVFYHTKARWHYCHLLCYSLITLFYCLFLLAFFAINLQNKRLIFAHFKKLICQQQKNNSFALVFHNNSLLKALFTPKQRNSLGFTLQ